MSANRKRRKWNAADKLPIALAGMQPNIEMSELCRREGINPTQYSFDGDDHVTLLTAVQPGGGVQQTQFNYGYSASLIKSNDLLAMVQYPAKDTGLPSNMS